MTAHRKIRLAGFTLEGLNSFATILYFNYFYFLLRDRFGFDNKRNLIVAAVIGLTYAVSAWQAGKFAQRRGYFAALKLGFAVMAGSLALGLAAQTAIEEILVAVAVNLGMCFIWPTLEALVSEGEVPARLPHIIGIYNVVWAVAYAIAFFIGGMLIESFGFQVIYLLPLSLMLVMLGLTLWMEPHAAKSASTAADTMRPPPPPEPHRPSPKKARSFLLMAWLANPFAYIAINTLIAVIPGIAAKFHLSPMLAGFLCSLWGFIRLLTFIILWRWAGWHYRFRWLLTAFALLILSFAVILMSPVLEVLIIAQIFFGGAIGLIYYSSLFYSMDAGDTKGEHGGIHEGAIGLGNCVGPAVGALSLQFLPQYANSGAIAVSVLLLGGLGGLVAIWKTAK